jgi:hypothetical protein
LKSAGEPQSEPVESVFDAGGGMLLFELGRAAGGDVGDADRARPLLHLRFFDLAEQARAPRHVEPAPRQQLIILGVGDRELAVPDAVGIGLEAEKVPGPVGIDADLRRELRPGIGAGVEARGQHIVCHGCADLRLREDQKVAESDADRHERVKVVRLGQERAVDLG